MMGVLGGVMLGLGATMMGQKQQQSAAASAADAHNGMAVTKPAVPELPDAPGAQEGDPSATDNAAMEAARERERLAAARRRLQAQEIFTSGLGAGGLAGTSKKTLLGG